MAQQASGSAAEIWYKIEKTNGITPSEDKTSGASSTLSEAVSPGATSIKVASATNVNASDVLRIGDGVSEEFVQVASDYSSGTTVGINPLTKLNFRHKSGEKVKGVDASKDWFKLGNVRSFTPGGGRELVRSQAVVGMRALSSYREGNYDVSADMTVEMDIASVGLFYLFALNKDYVTTGASKSGSKGSSALNGAVEAGAKEITVDAVTNFASNDFAQIGTGAVAEVVKIKEATGKKLPLNEAYHPQGLRFDHANDSSVVEVKSPFTHVITRGRDIPAGISFLLRFTDVGSYNLMRGCRVNTLGMNVSPDDLITLTLNVMGRATQTLGANLFGKTATAIPLVPYAHWESVMSIGGAEQAKNYFESLAINLENNIGGNFVIGSPFRGAITPGEGSVSGSFTYQYETQDFVNALIAGTEQALKFGWRYIGDANHEFVIEVPKAKFEGVPHPGVSDKSPITDEKNFVGRLDTSQEPNTDVKVTVKNNHPTAEYLKE